MNQTTSQPALAQPAKVAVWYRHETSWMYHRTEPIAVAQERLQGYADLFGCPVALFDPDVIVWQVTEAQTYGHALPSGGTLSPTLQNRTVVEAHADLAAAGAALQHASQERQRSVTLNVGSSAFDVYDRRYAEARQHMDACYAALQDARAAVGVTR